ncbi:MAG: NAD(P)-dependent oxidoreductase [Actinobacteria bacterium]|nr:NAD(P)-dependent oxidoreductase [Actinomycetota bacterium]
MGSAVAHALAQGGARVVATLAGRSPRTARLAAKAEVECVPGLEDVVRESDVVLSIAPPERAEAIAGELARAAAQAGARPLVADLNAIAPETVRRIGGSLAASGLELVDGSISGPPPWRADTTRIYLSGPRAPELAALALPGVRLVVVGPELGTASAVKMCTASVYKGTTALLAQALLTARHQGVVGYVLGDLEESLPELVDGVALGLARSATKSGRYVAEMREIATTQAAAGLPALFEAMAEVYAELSLRPVARKAPEELPADLSLEQVLDSLAPEPAEPGRTGSRADGAG